jgi:polysaccharide biosynthesis protein PslH
MQKILSIVWYKVLPPVYGGQKGIADFNSALSEYAELTCLCSKNNKPDETVPYKILPKLPVNKWQFINPFVWRKIIATAGKEKVSVILLEHPYHAIAAFLCKKILSVNLVIHSHNIESYRFRQMSKWWWRLLFYYERWIHRKASLSLFKTEDDLKTAVNDFGLNAGKCMVIPFGITKDEITDRSKAAEIIRKRHSILPAERILLFAGTLNYQPNQKAVDAIEKEIIPRLNNYKLSYKFIVCGNYNSASQPLTENLIFANEVRDISNYFTAADVFVNPVASGGGIQTKNIEALGYHCNLVCFERMLAGIDITVCENKIFSAAENDRDEFTEKIIKALTVPPSQTPESFFNYYSFTHHAEKLAARLNSL